jgi:hypothetical protein
MQEASAHLLCMIVQAPWVEDSVTTVDQPREHLRTLVLQPVLEDLEVSLIPSLGQETTIRALTDNSRAVSRVSVTRL